MSDRSFRLSYCNPSLLLAIVYANCLRCERTLVKSCNVQEKQAKLRGKDSQRNLEIYYCTGLPASRVPFCGLHRMQMAASHAFVRRNLMSSGLLVLPQYTSACRDWIPRYYKAC